MGRSGKMQCSHQRHQSGTVSPSCLVLSFWLLLPQKTCSALLHPFLPAGQKADCWPVFPWTDKSAKTDFASQKQHLFLFLSFSQLPVFWKVEKIIYPWSHYFLIKCGCLCTMQLYSLYVNVNRARIVNFSDISHPSHTAWVFPAPIIPWKPSSKHQDCRHQKGLTKVSGSVLQKWGIQYLQIARALVEHEQARPYETPDAVFLQKYLFSPCSSNPIIFPTHGTNNFQGVGEL